LPDHLRTEVESENGAIRTDPISKAEGRVTDAAGNVQHPLARPDVGE
jgi:hypothetical protein